MELQKKLNYRYLLTQALILGSLALLGGCKPEPIPNPENRDPIYSDLQAQEKATATDIEAEKKSIEETKAEIEKAPVRTADRHHAMRQLSQHIKKLEQLKQMDQYYLIRIEERKVFDEKDYMRAFNAEQPWPDPKEFEGYKAIRKLQTSSRNWDASVPKLTRYMKNPPPGAGAKKEAEKPAGPKEE